MYYNIFNETILSLEKGVVEEIIPPRSQRHTFTATIRSFASTMHEECLSRIASAIIGYQKEHRTPLYDAPPWDVLTKYADGWLMKQIDQITRTSVNMFIDQLVLPHATPPARLPEECYKLMNTFMERMYSKLYDNIYAVAIEIIPSRVESIFIDALDPPPEDPVEEMSKFSPVEYKAMQDVMLSGKPHINRHGISIFPFVQFCNALRNTTFSHILCPSKRSNRWSSSLDTAFRNALITDPNWPYRRLNNEILLSNIHANEFVGFESLDKTDAKAIRMIASLLRGIYRSTFIEGKPVGKINLDKIKVIKMRP
jgi:hypothetical protein